MASDPGGTGGAGTPLAGSAGTAGAAGDPQAGGTAGTSADAGEGGQAGDGGRTAPGDLLRTGRAAVSQQPRPEFAGLLVANDGERSYVVESRRDVEPGVFGLPWRTRFRLAAYDAGVEAWAYAADPDDVIGDLVIHPSGEITLSVQHQAAERLAYELVRLSPSGAVVASAQLSESPNIPQSDYAATDPRPLFRMKADVGDATTAGWVRLLADGEGLVVAFLSFIDLQPSRKLALGLATFDWQSGAYVERWARVVEGTHSAEPSGWAYDEFRWLEQAIRPFLARDDSSGELLVGRAWNSTRCQANQRTFAEFTAQDCLFGAVPPGDNERLPLAVTRFDASGARLGTRILRPDEDAAEQLAFALAARGGQLAVVGSVVRTLPDGSKRTYPDANGYVDYDGYIAVYDADGALLRSHDFNLGRGDVLAGMRWTADGILAVGAAGWDRWQGGMSITRGSDPLFVWLSADGSDSAERVVSVSDHTRHFNLHDLVLKRDAIVAVGFADAPMTHSADAAQGDNTPARTFGPLRIQLGSLE
ncbi:MAG: hypothetical protein WDO74_27945 [Pseudomonadota bacterium]